MLISPVPPTLRYTAIHRAGHGQQQHAQRRRHGQVAAVDELLNQPARQHAFGAAEQVVEEEQAHRRDKDQHAACHQARQGQGHGDGEKGVQGLAPKSRAASTTEKSSLSTVVKVGRIMKGISA